jgi:1,4-dihydroxy-2-naphthoate octaprenyltransferase
MFKLLQVSRPQFLTLGLALFIFGAAWAVLFGAPFSLARFLLGYLVIMPAHLSVSYSNDYFDVDVDKFGKPTLFSGGSGVLIEHPELREPAKWMAIGLILCSLLMGVVFQALYPYPLWFLGLILLGNLSGWFYSAPPLKLAYRGLGELLTIATAGFLLPMMGYLVARGSIDGNGLLFVVPLLLYAAAFTLIVEIPDLEVDRLGNKRTWVVRKGRAFGFALMAIAVLLATLFFVCFPFFFSRVYPLDFHVLGVFSLLPLGMGLIAFFKRPTERGAAIKLVGGIMASLAIFCLLADAYLIYLAFHLGVA